MSNKVKKSLCAIAATMLVLVSVFAVFTVPSKAEQWKITYYANDGSGRSLVYTVNYPSEITLPPKQWAEPEGTTFLGWCRNSDGTGDIYEPGTKINKLPYSEYMYAIYGYTVTFDVNGGKMQDESQMVQVVPMRGHATEPVMESTYQTAREGMLFVGWYEDLDPVESIADIPGMKFNFNSQITQNLTLTAVYSNSFSGRIFDESTGNQGVDRGGTFKSSITHNEISYSKTQNFTLYSDKVTYPVTLTAEPAEGYYFKEWRKGSTNGECVCKEAELKIDDPQKMDYVYYAVFTSDPMVSGIFNDVKETDWFAPFVLNVYLKGWMTGKSENTFAPNKPITREEFAQILYAHSGKPAVGAENPFKDVKTSQWYANAVLWAYQNGIVAGKKDKQGNPIFGVGQNITREELAAMLYKYYKFKNGDMRTFNGASEGYADSDQIDSWAKAQMDWAVYRGVLTGKGSGDKSQIKLSPRASASRAECAAMIKILSDLR